MTNPRRIKLTVAYDGSDFHGWAEQADQRTVQGILTETIRLVSGEETETTGASRTDSGAHAKGQICHFDTCNPMPMRKWAYVLNRQVPGDLHVVRAERVDPEFHSRFWAMHRWYRYRFADGKPDPMRARYTHHVSKRLDVEAMNQAAQALRGTHDFRKLSQLVDEETSTVRRIDEISVRRVRDEVWLDVTGTAFVRGMMRRIAGGLWEVGRGHWPTSQLETLLREWNNPRITMPPVLPAGGLTLMKIEYGKNPGPRSGAHDDGPEYN